MLKNVHGKEFFSLYDVIVSSYINKNYKLRVELEKWAEKSRDSRLRKWDEKLDWENAKKIINVTTILDFYAQNDNLYFNWIGGSRGIVIPLACDVLR